MDGLEGWRIEQIAKNIEALGNIQHAPEEIARVADELENTNKLLERIALAIEKGNEQRYLDSLSRRKAAAL